MYYNTGKHQDFYWVEFGSSDFDLIQLIEKLPNLIIGKHIGIVCFDGGVFTPTDEELKRGWYKSNEIGFSPIITKNELNGSIYEHHDQWCVFNELTEFEKMTDFVNYSKFSLKNRGHQLHESISTLDKKALKQEIEYNKSLQSKFWNEIEIIKPHSVIINGDFFIYCTKEEKEITEIITATSTSRSNLH